jgi:predicted nucleic acid-binding protein
MRNCCASASVPVSVIDSSVEEIEADQMIIDDLRGRREAERRGIHAIGTLGVLRIGPNAGS